jgi:hypothetical protein
MWLAGVEEHMADEEVYSYENPRTGLFKFSILVSFFLLLFMIFVILTDGLNMLILILIIPGMSFILLAGFYGDIYNRPYSVKITDEGIILLHKMKKEKYVKWNEIESTYSEKGSSNSICSNIRKGGSITIKGHVSPILLTSQIVNKLRERCYQITGNYPRNDDGR